MRRLFIVRHAKSHPAQIGLPDCERPLNSRGIHDASKMAHRLFERGVKIDHLMSSPALRARQTAEHFSYLLISVKQKMIENELYEAGVNDWLKMIRGLDASFSSVMMIGHNPSITELARRLGHPFSNVPTCAILDCQYNDENETGWRDFGKVTPMHIELDFPKKDLP